MQAADVTGSTQAMTLLREMLVRVVICVLFLGVIYSALVGIAGSVSVEGESQIRLNPAEFEVKIASAEKIDLQLRLSSGVASAIEFELKTTAEAQQLLNDKMLKISMLLEGAVIELGGAQAFTLPARSTQVATVSVDPREVTEDFSIEIPLILEQKAGSTRLTEEKQQIQLYIDSRVASQKQERQLDVIIAVGVASTALLLIGLVLFLNRKKE